MPHPYPVIYNSLALLRLNSSHKTDPSLPLSLKHWLPSLLEPSLFPNPTKPFSLASFFCILREDITGIKSKISVPHNSYTILLLFTISVHKTDYLTLKVRNHVPWFQGHTQCLMQSRVGTVNNGKRGELMFWVLLFVPSELSRMSQAHWGFYCA